MVTKDKKWWTFEVLGPSMIYNRFNREISCHHVTASLHHHITMSLCQSVICLAPCHQTSQSFALSPATKPVSHLPCPVPLLHHVTVLVICLTPCHQTSQSFALPPATKPVSHLPCPLPPHHRITVPPRHHVTVLVSHLPCPLPPNQSVICLAPYHRVTASPRHHITMPLHHCITASLPQIFPTTWVWIWLVNANQYSCDWLIVPTTANQITGIEKPNYHITLIFFPTTSLKWSHEARIDELADSNEPATRNLVEKLQTREYVHTLGLIN